MIKQPNRKEATQKRHRRLRAKLAGTTEAPRLAVYRSTKHIYAQIIDDVKGVTLASASSIDKDMRNVVVVGYNTTQETVQNIIIVYCEFFSIDITNCGF